MALLDCNFFSKSLMINTAVRVILPSPTPEETMFGLPQSGFRRGIRYQTLYLLHGALGDYTDWTRKSLIERFAEEHKLAVIMPSAENSCYADMVHGGAYWTYVSEELPEFCQTLFPLSEKREDNFAAGLSMGGFGAFKLALNQPERFAAAASLSGALEIIHDRKKEKMKSGININDVYKNPMEISGTEDDLYFQISRLKKSGKTMPKLYQACGTEDQLYPLNLHFRDRARALGADLTYQEGPGIHDWKFWNAYIEKALNWMPLKNSLLF